MASTPGKWIYAVDRREVMAGRANELREMAGVSGTTPTVRILRSPRDEGDLGGTQQVRQQIEIAPTHHASDDHVVVIITHAGLMSADMRTFTGWTAIIDEAPNTLTSGVCRSPALTPWLERAYNLDSATLAGTGWAQVRATSYTPTPAQVSADSTLAAWLDFHRRVVSAGQPVICSLSNWGDATDGRVWHWFSAWTFSSLQAFTDVIILANAFRETLAHFISRALEPAVEFLPLPIPDARTWVQRRAIIGYFTEGHQSGTTFWSSRAGRDCLGAVARWLAANITADHVWTSNNAFAPFLSGFGIPGERLAPRQHGANQFRHITKASALYAAKVSPDERQIIEALGLSSAQVVRAREHEDLLQFVLRTSLRVPHDPRPVELYVYDKVQASFLAEALGSSGYIDVKLAAIDIGLLGSAKPRPGRPPIAPVATRTEAERKRDRRSESRNEKIKNGTYRPRGRPPTSAISAAC